MGEEGTPKGLYDPGHVWHISPDERLGDSGRGTSQSSKNSSAQNFPLDSVTYVIFKQGLTLRSSTNFAHLPDLFNEVTNC